MRRFLPLIFFIASVQAVLHGQDTTKITVPAKIILGDTLPEVNLNSVIIVPAMKFDGKRDAARYDRMVYNIKLVYPYAKLAGIKLKQIKTVLDTISNDRQRRAFLKKSEKELEAQFGNQIRDLTFSQGKILIKLIYRETGSSTFSIARELKGGFNAFVYQTLARLFGYDLKTIYDPQGQDAPIERVILMIDAGAM